jgi:hypothetical protein
MTFKTLLLGSAATIALVGVAQAADLSIAEPVESVRVCDAFGTGFWYIPGTETCLKIGGSVEFDVNIHSSINVAPTAGPTHYSNWDFVTTAKLNVTAQSVTDYGDLVGYIGFRADYNNGPYGPGAGNDTAWYLDDAWLSLGPLMVGNQFSTFNTAGIGAYTGFGHVYTDLNSTDQVRLTYAMGGFGVMLGVEDPRDRWGSSLSASYNMPDLVAAITGSGANWDGKIALGYAQLDSGSAYGIAGSLTIKLNSIAQGDQIKLGAAYGNGSYTGLAATPGGVNNTWSAFAGFQHFWSATVSSGLDISYANDAAGNDYWQGGASLVWAPVSGFSAGLYGFYAQSGSAPGAWTGQIALVREW